MSGVSDAALEFMSPANNLALTLAINPTPKDILISIGEFVVNTVVSGYYTPCKIFTKLVVAAKLNEQATKIRLAQFCVQRQNISVEQAYSWIDNLHQLDSRHSSP